ncbi:MAG: hypothetical protein AUK64_1855 [bacterium P201]|mgnify:FL=1|nr:MAG: hypothetical protein AUK64_1855 [bacterium P201]
MFLASNAMKYYGIILCGLLYTSIVSCEDSREDKLKAYLKHQYPYEYAEIIKVEERFDSIYDPNDTLIVIMAQIENIEQKPDVESILNDKKHSFNAIGRKARIKLYNSERVITVMYNNNDEVIHTSLQNERLGENIISKYFERFHRYDDMWWPHR